MADTIICPQCQCEIEVTEVLSAQLRTQIRKEFDAAQRKKEADLAEREAKLNSESDALVQARATIDEQVATKLVAERRSLEEQALTKAKEQVAIDLQDKDQQLNDLQSKLKTAQTVELNLRKDRRALEEEKATLELTVTRRLDEERDSLRAAAKKEVMEERQLKEAEKDKHIADLGAQIEDLKRKSEQGSQQLQGEVLEINLEDLLRQQFPYDSIVPVPKGVHGGDVLQIVHDGAGTECGILLWESKRTKAWSDGWLAKLRDDQRAAKAHFALLVSTELPKGTSNFQCHEGVWVTNRSCALSLATALRTGLIELAAAKRSLDGKHDKMELLYTYLSGAEFRHRVEGIVESFVTMREDLEAEKRAIQKHWAKREKQLDRAVACTVGMHGDISGLIGKALAPIKQLELPEPSDDEEPLLSAGTLTT